MCRWDGSQGRRRALLLRAPDSLGRGFLFARGEARWCGPKRDRQLDQRICPSVQHKRQEAERSLAVRSVLDADRCAQEGAQGSPQQEDGANPGNCAWGLRGSLQDAGHDPTLASHRRHGDADSRQKTHAGRPRFTQNSPGIRKNAGRSDGSPIYIHRCVSSPVFLQGPNCGTKWSGAFPSHRTTRLFTRSAATLAALLALESAGCDSDIKSQAGNRGTLVPT